MFYLFRYLNFNVEFCIFLGQIKDLINKLSQMNVTFSLLFDVKLITFFKIRNINYLSKIYTIYYIYLYDGFYFY